MIDIHCHILPGIDDGPGNIEDAVRMAKIALASGIDTVVATPHFLNMVYEVDQAGIEHAVDLLRNALVQQDIGLKIFSGAEIRMMHDTCRLLDKGKLPSLAGSDYYLFELPEIFIKDGILMVLRQLRDREVIPVIAHPERNYTIMKTPGLIRDLGFEKAKFQLTGQSVLGKNGKISHKISKQMIGEGTADFIASDGHDPEFRQPCLSHLFKAVKKISNEHRAQQIMIENPGQILEQDPGNKLIGKKAG